MAQLPRRRTLHLSPTAALALAVVLLLAPAPAGAQVNLEGTWHVLVHYTDDNTSHPDQPRWLDRVWAFESKGSRIQWTEYPIAVFEDESGRFERRSTGQYARTLGAWKPTPGQLQNIRDGVRVNTRGMKRRSLRGSDDGGWRTVSRARAGSASVITYQENWSVEGMPSLPVFIQQDLMGSGRSETLEGVTRFETSSVEQGGQLLLGSFERDGTRHGTFQLRRAGSVGMLEEKSQEEIQAQGFRRGVASSQMVRQSVREEIVKGLADNGITLPDQQIDAVVDESITLYLQGVEGHQLREQLLKRMAGLAGSEAVREQIKRVLAENGISLADEEVDVIVSESLALYLEGVRGEQLREEVMKRVQQRAFGWVRSDAVHDDSTRYHLPFASDVPRELSIGPQGSMMVAPFSVGGGSKSLTRREELRNTYVFKMPVGSSVVAAREGQVVRAAGSLLTVLHADSSFASYWPLGEISVEAGQEVQTGDPLGVTGTLDRPGVHSDIGSEPQLDFGVFVGRKRGGVKSLPVLLDDGTQEGMAPVTGLSYGGD